MVPARAPGAERFAGTRVLRVVGQRPCAGGHPHHLLRHREIELDLGPGGRPVLLAPLLFAPARPQLRQPGGARGSAAGDALLARPRRGRPAPGRGAVPDRARRHQQREPARDPRHPEEDPRGGRRPLPRPPAAGGSQHVARGHPAVLRGRRRVPHGVPLPADAAHVHGDRARGPLPDQRHPAPDPGHPGQLPVGDLPAQPRRAHAGDGHRQRARLPVADLCRRPARAHQPRHPPPACTAAPVSYTHLRAHETAAASN